MKTKDAEELLTAAKMIDEEIGEMLLFKQITQHINNDVLSHIDSNIEKLQYAINSAKYSIIQ